MSGSITLWSRCALHVPPPSREPPTERPPPTTALAARASEPHAPIEEPGGLCCVCLELHLHGSGEHAAAPFPTCTRHYLHVGCLAQFRVQASTASELLCPLCRHSRCPDCDPHGWGAQHDAAVREACAREGVPMPSRLTGEDTVRGAVRDYALRNFTGNDAPEPPPPPGVSVLCCNRIAAVAAAGGVDFVSLPHRAMQWAPVPIRHEAGIAAWQPGWVCPACAEELRLADLDILSMQGNPVSTARVSCVGSMTALLVKGCSAAHQVVSAPPVYPARQPLHGLRAAPLEPTAGRPTRGAAFWRSRGPPAGDVPTRGSTSRYCTRPLPPSRPSLSRHGGQNPGQLTGGSLPGKPSPRRLQLRPMPSRTRSGKPSRRYQLKVRHLPDILHRLELTSTAPVSVGWAVRQLSEPDGYLIAPVQEALLCYGGHALASAIDRHSDRFRPRPRSPPAPVAADPADATVRRRGRRRRRGARMLVPLHERGDS